MKIKKRKLSLQCRTGAEVAQLQQAVQVRHKYCNPIQEYNLEHYSGLESSSTPKYYWNRGTSA